MLIAVANAGLLPTYQQGPAVYQQPAALIQQRVIQPAPVVQQIATPVLAKQAEEYDPNPQYSFSYDIHVSSKGLIEHQHHQITLTDELNLRFQNIDYLGSIDR